MGIYICTTRIHIYMHLYIYGSMCNRYILLWVMTHNQDITGPKANNHRIPATCIISPVYEVCESITKYYNHNIYSHSIWIVLHHRVWSTRFAIVDSYLSLYCTISTHAVTGSIIVKYFSMRGSSWPSLLILYGPLQYTNNLS